MQVEASAGSDRVAQAVGGEKKQEEEEEDANIDPVMKKYMQMVAEQRAKAVGGGHGGLGHGVGGSGVTRQGAWGWLCTGSVRACGIRA